MPKIFGQHFIHSRLQKLYVLQGTRLSAFKKLDAVILKGMSSCRNNVCRLNWSMVSPLHTNSVLITAFPPLSSAAMMKVRQFCAVCFLRQRCKRCWKRSLLAYIFSTSRELLSSLHCVDWFNRLYPLNVPTTLICGFPVLQRQFVSSYAIQLKPKLKLNKRWFRLEFTENNSYRKEVWCVGHIAARSAWLWFYRTIVIAVL
jgi:hypothetical protein